MYTLLGQQEPERLAGQVTTYGFLRVLGVRPAGDDVQADTRRTGEAGAGLYYLSCFPECGQCQLPVAQ